MEVISLKLDKHMLQDIDKNLKKHNFSTRTEFVRTAIRDKLEKMTKDELLQTFLDSAGTWKRKNPGKNWRRVRQEAFEDLIKERDWD